MKFRLKSGNIAESADMVILNASNTKLYLGTGVSGAIRSASEDDYQDYLTKFLDSYNQEFDVGDVLLTAASDSLPSRYIIHAAVLEYREGTGNDTYPDISRVKSCYDKIWPLLESVNEDEVSLSLVPLGTGAGGLGLAGSWEVMCQSLQLYLSDHINTKITKITFYAYNLPETLVAQKVISKYFELSDEE